MKLPEVEQEILDDIDSFKDRYFVSDEPIPFCGLKLYLYLASNKDGYKWTLNPSVYATWLGLDYSNSSTARAVRKAINDGIADLVEKGYLIVIDENNFEFMEQKVP